MGFDEPEMRHGCLQMTFDTISHLMCQMSTHLPLWWAYSRELNKILPEPEHFLNPSTKDHVGHRQQITQVRELHSQPSLPAPFEIFWREQVSGGFPGPKRKWRSR